MNYQQVCDYFRISDTNIISQIKSDGLRLQKSRNSHLPFPLCGWVISLDLIIEELKSKPTRQTDRRLFTNMLLNRQEFINKSGVTKQEYIKCLREARCILSKPAPLPDFTSLSIQYSASSSHSIISECTRIQSVYFSSTIEKQKCSLIDLLSKLDISQKLLYTLCIFHVALKRKLKSIPKGCKANELISSFALGVISLAQFSNIVKSIEKTVPRSKEDQAAILHFLRQKKEKAARKQDLQVTKLQCIQRARVAAKETKKFFKSSPTVVQKQAERKKKSASIKLARQRLLASVDINE